jgi:hypothetical protein
MSRDPVPLTYQGVRSEHKVVEAPANSEVPDPAAGLHLDTIGRDSRYADA